MPNWQITYEQRYWNDEIRHWQLALNDYSGVEFCLKRAELTSPFYIERFREVVALGKAIRFHLPHHWESEGLKTSEWSGWDGDADDYSGKALSDATFTAYCEYYKAISHIAAAPTENPIYVVHHPIAKDYDKTFHLLDQLHRDFSHYGIYPILEPTGDTQVTLAYLKERGLAWKRQYGYSPYCLDICYLNQLGIIESQGASDLLSMAQVIHYHSVSHAHGPVTDLTEETLRWLLKALELNIPICLEILLRGCEGLGTHYLESLSVSKDYLLIASTSSDVLPII